MSQIIRLRPFHYMHILDANTNIVSLVTGPCKFTCLDHHKVVQSPTKMIFVPPRHFVKIDNPVRRTEGKVEMEKSGQVRLRHGDQEIRFSQEPFALYDGEKSGAVQELRVVPENSALVLCAKRAFYDETARVERRPGEEWLFLGPETYYPHVCVEVSRTQDAQLLQPNKALMLRANVDCLDYQKKQRKAGEKWLVTGNGAYLPSIHESIVTIVKGHVLTDKQAIHVRASLACTDALEVQRKAGEEWLVTKEKARVYIPGIHEKVVTTIGLTIVPATHFCIIRNPVDDKTGLPDLGKTKLIKGPLNFFLKPGEILEGGIKERFVLTDKQAIWLEAVQGFTDETGEKRKPGEEWILYGPLAYCTPSEVVVRQTIDAFFEAEPLGMNFFRKAFFSVPILLFFIFYFFNYVLPWIGALTLGSGETEATDTGSVTDPAPAVISEL